MSLAKRSKSYVRREVRLGGRLLFEKLENRVLLAVFHPISYVTDGDSDSLRAAIQAANTNGEDDTIILEQGVYDLTLANAPTQENNGEFGDLDVAEANHTLTIRGQGAGLSIIDAHQLDRIFQVLPDVSLVLNGVSIRNGKAQDDGSAGVEPGSTFFAGGGGILGEAGSTITLNSVALEQCEAFGGGRTWGGGIYTSGNLTLNGSLLAGNSAVANGSASAGRSAAGGGIYADLGGSLIISNSTLANNQAKGGMPTSSGNGGAGQGGALFSFQPVTFISSKVQGNLAAGGDALGGSAVGGEAQGGGLCLVGDVTLNNTVVAHNQTLGGIGADATASGATGGAGGRAQGGGLYLATGHSLEVSTFSFTLNLARGGDGGKGADSPTVGGAGGDGGIGEGGGLLIAGTATLVNGALFNNDVVAGSAGHSGQGSSGYFAPRSSDVHGGAVAIAGGTATLITVTVSSNNATGGIGDPQGVTELDRGTALGAGIYISSNSLLNIKNTTIANNLAHSSYDRVTGVDKGCGGVFSHGTVNAVSTIIAYNSEFYGSHDFVGAFSTADHVLLQRNAGATGINDGENANIVGQDPKLGPLANHRGATKTQLLLPGSPAINAGLNPLALATDQRGLPRVINGVDIGAVEFQAPRVALSGTSTFVENAVSLVLAPSAGVTDTDNADFNGGDLTVTITANANANDRLQIKNQGTGAGQIGVSGSNVSFGGTAIGTFSGGTGSAPLVVTFTSGDATPAATQALVRAITFRTVTEDPSTAPRTVTFVVNDGDGFSSDPAVATKTVKVTAVNDKPVLSFSGTIGYVHDQPAITLVPFATVKDVDNSDFSGGRLRVRITDGAGTSNRLTIGASFTIDASGNVLQGTTIIGKRTSNGFGTKELIVTFTSAATPAVVQQLVRAITFKTVGGGAGQRNVVFTVSDGDGGLSDEVSKIVNVT